MANYTKLFVYQTTKECLNHLYFLGLKSSDKVIKELNRNSCYKYKDNLVLFDPYNMLG